MSAACSARQKWSQTGDHVRRVVTKGHVSQHQANFNKCYKLHLGELHVGQVLQVVA